MKVNIHGLDTRAHSKFRYSNHQDNHISYELREFKNGHNYISIYLYLHVSISAYLICESISIKLYLSDVCCFVYSGSGGKHSPL